MEQNVYFNFGATDTDPISILMNREFNLRYLAVRPVDKTANDAPAALASEVTLTVYKNGSSIGTITTSGSAFILTDISDARFAQGDVLAVTPSAAAGTNRGICLTLIGI